MAFFQVYLFTYLFLLCWVFVSARGLSLVVASGGHSSLRCAGLSLSRPLLLQSTGSRRAGSVVVAHGPSCSAACGILPDQGSNPCPLHWQADSQPLCHQGSPEINFNKIFYLTQYTQHSVISVCNQYKKTNEIHCILFYTKSWKLCLPFTLTSTSQFRLVTFQGVHNHIWLVATILDGESIEYKNIGQRGSRE